MKLQRKIAKSFIMIFIFISYMTKIKSEDEQSEKRVQYFILIITLVMIPHHQNVGCYFLMIQKNSNMFFYLMEKPLESTFQLVHTKKWQK